MGLSLKLTMWMTWLYLPSQMCSSSRPNFAKSCSHWIRLMKAEASITPRSQITKQFYKISYAKYKGRIHQFFNAVIFFIESFLYQLNLQLRIRCYETAQKGRVPSCWSLKSQFVGKGLFFSCELCWLLFAKNINFKNNNKRIGTERHIENANREERQ